MKVSAKENSNFLFSQANPDKDFPANANQPSFSFFDVLQSQIQNQTPQAQVPNPATSSFQAIESPSNSEAMPAIENKSIQKMDEVPQIQEEPPTSHSTFAESIAETSVPDEGIDNILVEEKPNLTKPMNSEELIAMAFTQKKIETETEKLDSHVNSNELEMDSNEKGIDEEELLALSMDFASLVDKPTSGQSKKVNTEDSHFVEMSIQNQIDDDLEWKQKETTTQFLASMTTSKTKDIDPIKGKGEVKGNEQKLKDSTDRLLQSAENWIQENLISHPNEASKSSHPEKMETSVKKKGNTTESEKSVLSQANPKEGNPTEASSLKQGIDLSFLPKERFKVTSEKKSDFQISSKESAEIKWAESNSQKAGAESQSDKNHSEQKSFAQNLIQNLSSKKMDSIASAKESQKSNLDVPKTFQEMVDRARIHIVENGKSTAEIRMFPGEYGRMRLSLSVSGEKVEGKIFVETELAKEALSQEMKTLKAELKSSGLELDSLQLELFTDSDSQNSYEDFLSRKEYLEAGEIQKKGKNSQRKETEVSENVSSGTNQRGKSLVDVMV